MSIPVNAYRVDDAIKAYRELPKDKTAQALMVLIGSTDRILHRFAVEKDQAVGFNEVGTELVRVPLTEPVIDRPAFDERLGAVRNNTP